MADSRPLPPDDFGSLFRCAEDLSRTVLQEEARNLFEYLELPADWRLRALQELHRIGRKVPTPAEVTRVERGSWLVVLSLSGPVILFVLKKYMHPVVQEAWDGSHLRNKLKAFLQERLFRGTRDDLERKAIESPKYGNLRIVRVEESTSTVARSPGIEVHLERQQVIEVHSSDQELLDAFIDRLQDKNPR